MKKLITILMLFSTALSFGQFNTKDTLINNRWVRMSIPTNYSTVDSLSMIVFFPGRGEVGTGLITDTAKISVGGPHGYIKQGWNGHVILSKDTIRPLIITIQGSDWQPPASLFGILDKVQLRFPKAKNIHLTGLSLGGWSAGGFVTYQATAGDLSRIKKYTSIVTVKGVQFGDASAATPPFPERFGFFSQVGGKLLAIESGLDYRHGDKVAAAMGANGQYLRTDIGSAGHGAFNWFYGGGGKQPSIIPVGGTQQNIYQWMIRQGDTLQGNKPAPVDVTIIPSADTILLTVDTVLLSALPDAPGYEWRQVVGPSCIIESPNNIRTVIRGLQAGVYVFEVSREGQRKAIVLKVVLPKVLGTFRVIQMPDGTIRIEPQKLNE